MTKKRIIKSIIEYKKLVKTSTNRYEIEDFRKDIFNDIYLFCIDTDIIFKYVTIGNIRGKDTYFKVDGVKYD